MQNQPQFILDLRDTNNIESSRQAAQILLQTVESEPKMLKPITLDFLKKCNHNMQDKSIPGVVKIHTLLIFHEILKNPKAARSVFTLLCNHPLLVTLMQTAINVDPRKPMNEKGKLIFPDDKKTGNLLMRLLLQGLVKWAAIYRFGAKQQPSKYMKCYQTLKKEQVVLPKSDEFMFYELKVNRKQNNHEKPKGNPKDKDFGKEIQYMLKKINNLMDKIAESSEVSQVEPEIISCHATFQKQLIKIQNLDQSVMQNQSPQTMEIFNKVMYFMAQEKDLYQKQVSNGNLPLYISKLESLYNEIFPEDNQSVNSKKQRQSNHQQKGYSKAQKPQVKIQKPQVKPTNNNEKVHKDKESDVVNGIFKKLSSYSPHKGFRSVSSTIQNQVDEIENRKQVVTGISRKKDNKSKQKMTMTSVLRTSKIADIFTRPPNLSLPGHNYEGELVVENINLQKVLYELKDIQGFRKFKVINFRNHHLLLENVNLQIGYKSEAVYEKVQTYDSMISIQLFFGNKSPQKLTDFQINFIGDTKCLVFTNPQTIQTEIQSGSQLKLQMIVIPTSVPFGFVSMRICYKYSGSFVHTMAILPTSILKLTTYSRLTKSQFQSKWQNYQFTLKTQPFKLSRYFPPIKIDTYITALTQITHYNEFAEEGSTTDYQLGCQILIKQSNFGLLKIIVRPNMDCVLQAKIRQNNEQNCNNLKFFLQTLQMILRSTETL